MDVVIIKYNAGNILSVDYALQRLGITPIITDDHELIKKADKVIFPGVGEASTTMNYLKERKLDILIKDLKQPVLGICLGMQLMCKYSEEGNTECLGIFNEVVKRFTPPPDKKNEYKVPHMGWNDIFNLKGKLYRDIPEHTFVYFVHSYYVDLGEHTTSTCEYIVPFSASLEYKNFFATQFHPEKSSKVGSKILENFLNI